ncbi:MAG: Rrf2 family transcriptional regulator [Planctomycetes bacterium]|nr:Rrf2 family transcriptional regulator [Planctomycetota bacterium]
MLSRSSEYAIRALTYLAQRQRDGRHVLARDMAEELGIPAPFLGKVLQPLVTRGLLHSQRGRSGGFRLDRPAGHIRLVEIVETQETLTPANTCLLGQKACDEQNVCPLHELWTGIAGSFHTRLRATSLQDLVEFAARNPGCAYPFQPDLARAAQATAPIPLRDGRAVSA